MIICLPQQRLLYFRKILFSSTETVDANTESSFRFTMFYPSVFFDCMFLNSCVQVVIQSLSNRLFTNGFYQVLPTL